MRPTDPRPPFKDLEPDAQAYLERAHKAVGLMLAPDDPRYGQLKSQANETALSYSQALSAKRIADMLQSQAQTSEIAIPTPQPFEPYPKHHPWTARLAQVNKRTGEEQALFNAVQMVEHMGGHPLLTEAQAKITEALCALGAWTDAGKPGWNRNDG